MKKQEQTSTKFEDQKGTQSQQNPNNSNNYIYNLPSKLKVSISEYYYSVRKHLSFEKENKYSKENSKLVSDIDKFFESHLFSWQEDNKWSFNLPKTVFKGEQSPIKFFKPQEHYGIQDLNKLTPEQIASIKQSGKFIIKGNTPEQSQTWKLNPFIVRGQQYIQKCYHHGLGVCYGQMTDVKLRLGWKYTFSNASIRYRPNLFYGLIGISYVGTKLIDLIFGMRCVKLQDEKEIWEEILKENKNQHFKTNHTDINTKFFDFCIKNSVFYSDGNLYSKSKNFHEKQSIKKQVADLEALQKEFKIAADILEKKRLSELELQNVDEKDALYQIFEEKQQLLFDQIQQSNYIKDQEVKDHLIELITVTQIVKRYQFQLKQDLEQYSDQVYKELINNHRIKSQVMTWLDEKVDELVKIKKLELQKEYNQKIIKELNDNNLYQYAKQYIRYAELETNKEIILEQNFERIQNKNIEPSKVFYNFEQYSKPYDIKQSVSKNGEVYYSLIRGKEYKTPSDFFGWRIALAYVKMKVWTKSAFVHLIDNIINGQLGLKALFKHEPFTVDQLINSKTGQTQEIKEIKPYLILLKESLISIQKSIENFEAKPDRGLIGKSFARIFKYIESALTFLFSITFIGVGMPVAVLANTIISFILAITSWAWVPIGVVARMISNILLIDLDSPQYKDPFQRYSTSPYLPIVSVMIDIIKYTGEIAASLASAFIIHPSISIVAASLTLLRRSLQSLSDKFMLMITALIGRQPEIDTFFAWKVKNEGDEYQRIYSIKTEDAKFLIRAHLEKIELEEYQKRLFKKINEPQEVFNEVSKSLFKFYDIYQPDNQIIRSSIDLYIEILNKQIEERTKKYPSLPDCCDIKFTEAELSRLFFESQNLIKKYIEDRQMEWIFEKYEIQSKNYKALTETILVKIFQDKSVLYPINENKQRTEIITEKQNHFDSIYNEISNDSLLSNDQKPFKKYQNQELFPFISIHDIQEYFFAKQTYFNLSDPASEAFYFNIQEYQKVIEPTKQNQNEDDDNNN